QQFRKDLAASVEVVQEARRGPMAYKRVMPSRLARVSLSGVEGPVRRLRGRRELRERTVIAARRLVSGAFASLLGPIAVTLLVLGVLFLGLPELMGYIAGALLLIVAAWLGLQVWRRRNVT